MLQVWSNKRVTTIVGEKIVVVVIVIIDAFAAVSTIVIFVVGVFVCVCVARGRGSGRGCTSDSSVVEVSDHAIRLRRKQH